MSNTEYTIVVTEKTEEIPTECFPFFIDEGGVFAEGEILMFETRKGKKMIVDGSFSDFGIGDAIEETLKRLFLA
jgi:hypothetical protein